MNTHDITGRDSHPYASHGEPKDAIPRYRLPAVDLYGQVHKGLRVALCELLTRMTRTDADHLAEVQGIVDDLTGLLYLCEAHAEHENRFLHRAIEARQAGGSSARAGEHEAQRYALATMHTLILRSLEAEPETRVERWRGLQLAFATLVGDLLIHMTQEEVVTQAQLETLYSDAELHALHGQLVSAIGLDEYTAFMRLMLRAASPRERGQLEEILRATQPERVRQAILARA